jgi:hypothetical protein
MLAGFDPPVLGNRSLLLALWATKGEREMALQDELRQAAASCLDIAQTTADTKARTRLLLLAQKFFELANGSPSDLVLAKLLDEFNDAQMFKQ